MAWNGITQKTANAIFGEHGIKIVHLENVKIYKAIKGSDELMSASCTQLCQLILNEWFSLKHKGE